MKNFNIGVRILAGFAVILVLLVASIVLGVTRLGELKDGMDDTIKVQYPKVLKVSELHNEVNTIARAARNVLIFQDKKMVDQEVALIAKQEADGTPILQYLRDAVHSDQGKAKLANVIALRETFLKSIHQYVSLVKDGNFEAAKPLLEDPLRPQQLAYMSALEDLVNYQSWFLEQAFKHAEDVYFMARLVLLIVGGVAVLLGIGIAIAIARGITRPIAQAVQIAETIAKGDLTSKIDVTRNDETGLLLSALKEMNGSLAAIVAEVRSGTDTISTASLQIASGSMDLSSRTEQQASSLEETASSMEELASTVKQNADNAREANRLAASASDIATRGGDSVAHVVQTMGAINASASKVADIISVIDGIAFQTNILALNAAVEAARAGEQGRGFAVVASEVRSLAQRSASAAREIKELINASVSEADKGSRLVKEAGDTMSEVVESIRRVTGIMAEIAAASQEQSAGIEQVNQAVVQMDEVTQQNAALVEEAAASAASMQDEAKTLLTLVSRFRLSGMAAQHMPAATVPPAMAKPQPARRALSPVAEKSLAKPAYSSTSKPAAPAPRSTPVARPAGDDDGEWTEF